MPAPVDTRPAAVARNGEPNPGRAGACAVALVATLVAGCASFVAPKPPPYTGPDTVEAVDESAFVGDWRLVALNPIEGQEEPARTLSYAADGTFSGEILPTEEMKQVMGDEPIRMSGTWRVDGGRLVNSTESVEMPEGGGLVSQLVSRMVNPGNAVAGSAEIYEVDADRIVVVTDEGYASALERR